MPSFLLDKEPAIFFAGSFHSGVIDLLLIGRGDIPGIGLSLGMTSTSIRCPRLVESMKVKIVFFYFLCCLLAPV